jgi:hypothetical protein
MSPPVQSNANTKGSRFSLSRFLEKSASSGRHRSRQYYPGATIYTNFTTKDSNNGRTPTLAIKYSVNCTPELEKKLEREGTKRFDECIKAKVKMTTEKMMEDWEFDEKRICEREVKQQAETYQSRLDKNLEGTGIDHATDYWVNPEKNHLCQCRDSNITGASLQFERLAVFTRCDKTGQPIVSKYHSMTPYSIPADPPETIAFIRPDLPPLTDIEIDARKEFLKKFHNTFQELVAEDSRRNPGRTLDNAPKRNQAILDTMTRGSEYSNMAHIVQYTDANDVLALPWTVYVDHNKSYWPVEEWTK